MTKNTTAGVIVEWDTGKQLDLHQNRKRNGLLNIYAEKPRQIWIITYIA